MTSTNARYTYRTYADPTTNRAIVTRQANGRAQLLVSHVLSTPHPESINHRGLIYERQGAGQFLRGLRHHWTLVATTTDDY